MWWEEMMERERESKEGRGDARKNRQKKIQN
jgi:hypothetical protein